MSSPIPLEQELLAPVEQRLDSALRKIIPSERQLARFQLLEEVAALIGGFPVNVLREMNDTKEPDYIRRLNLQPQLLVDGLLRIPVHPALSLSALARPYLTGFERRNHGVYYTDFRLAEFLASNIKNDNKKIIFIDPACGSGILLTALVLKLAKKSKRLCSKFLAHSVCGADLSSDALRGARLTLSSLTDDIASIKAMAARLRQMDSLISGVEAWRDVAPLGFDAVIGNPPWERLRLTRHEWLKANGRQRHYGDDYRTSDFLADMEHKRDSLTSYLKILENKFAHQGRGDQDLYKLFVELAFGIIRPKGQLAFLIPGGFIRSYGTSELRAFAFDVCSDISLTIFDNKPRFFQIDSRFKFLLLHGRIAHGRSRKMISLAHASANGVVYTNRAVNIPYKALISVRPDFSIPEVKTSREWKLFYEFVKKGKKLRDPDGPWQPKLMREVDMTQDKDFLIRQRKKSALPLIEGRMVHQYRFTAKRYVSGTGRRATWLPNERENMDRICPQYYIPIDKLPCSVQERINKNRAGFCDITGQTNERTMLASRIPSKVVCGNKVPTVIFNNGSSIDQQRYIDCWLAIVNSFSFDWLVRRVATTSLNYFLLLNLPMPLVDPNSAEGRRLSRLSEQFSQNSVKDPWEQGETRAEIEWRVLNAYGHDASTFELFLQDFPLLDRAQPALPGEKRSTVTRDLVLLKAAKHLGGISKEKSEILEERVVRARELGAVPFVPSHLNAYD